MNRVQITAGAMPETARSRGVRCPASALLRSLLVLLCLSSAGLWLAADACAQNTPARTRLSEPAVIIPAEIVGNHLIVTVKGDKSGPWHFLVDTGSSVTLVSSEFARRRATGRTTPDIPAVRVRSASGDTVMLTGVELERLDLGGARFERTPALVYDCSELTAHFGRKIDGILGFPLFSDTILSLDYPQSRLILQPATATTLRPGRTLRFDAGRRMPLIPVQLDGRTFLALIDSGSDGSLHLNPLGLAPRYATPPRPGATVGTLSGNHLQEIGRLAQDLTVGGYTLTRPIVELTGELSSLGGALLRHFTVTFDQTRSQVTFYRESSAPIVTPHLRSAGLAFQKSPAYWRVVGIVPGSPADELGLAAGSLVTRINGDRVENWTLARYDTLVRTTPGIRFTFLDGREEKTETIQTFDLVP